MSAENPNDNGQLITNLREPVKQYIVYDVSNRPVIIYEARANALNDEPCFKTEYAYDGATSRILKRKESNATWDSAWDL
jgi:hypothetical protein